MIHGTYCSIRSVIRWYLYLLFMCQLWCAMYVTLSLLYLACDGLGLSSLWPCPVVSPGKCSLDGNASSSDQVPSFISGSLTKSIDQTQAHREECLSLLARLYPKIPLVDQMSDKGHQPKKMKLEDQISSPPLWVQENLGTVSPPLQSIARSYRKVLVCTGKI